MLRAASIARDVPLRIVGTGPQEDELKAVAASEGLDNVEFMGYRTGVELKALFAGALFVVVPSECFENSPLTVYEALALGNAVLGSTMGGIPELVEEGRTGLLFEAGNHEALAGTMRALGGDPAGTVEMGRAGRRKIERDYAPARHYERVLEIYERAIT